MYAYMFGWLYTGTPVDWKKTSGHVYMHKHTTHRSFITEILMLLLLLALACPQITRQHNTRSPPKRPFKLPAYEQRAEPVAFRQKGCHCVRTMKNCAYAVLYVLSWQTAQSFPQHGTFIFTCVPTQISFMCSLSSANVTFSNSALARSMSNATAQCAWNLAAAVRIEMRTIYSGRMRAPFTQPLIRRATCPTAGHNGDTTPQEKRCANRDRCAQPRCVWGAMLRFERFNGSDEKPRPPQPDAFSDDIDVYDATSFSQREFANYTYNIVCKLYPEGFHTTTLCWFLLGWMEI